MSRWQEIAVPYACDGTSICAVQTEPASPNRSAIVIVSGGLYYRIGILRQSVHIARFLAERGYRVLRFDIRGTGDTIGALPGLDSVASDIAAAAKAVLAAPCRELFLWGRCGGATAILNTLSTLPNVTKVVAINPWLPDTTPTNGGTVIDHCFDEILNYRGQLLLVLTNGPTADQWRSLLLTHAAGRMVAAAKHVTWYNFPQANHAISDRRHLRQLLANALSWSADEISIEAKR